MKIMIAVIGNLATGKSTVCRLLNAELENFAYLSIDQFREIHNASTQRGESNAWQALKIAVYQNDNVIFESSGSSKNYKGIIDLFKSKGGRVVVFKLHCSIHESLIRRRNQIKAGYKPPPYAYQSNMVTTITRIYPILEQIYSDYSFDTSVENPECIVKSIVLKFAPKKTS